MFKKIWIAAALSMMTFSSSAVLAQEKYEWTMVSPLTSAIDYVSLYKDMVDRVDEKTEGRLKINLLTYGQHPFKDADMINAVQNNIIQIANFADAYISSVEPSVAVMSLPFLFDDLGHAKKTYTDLKENHFSKLFDEKFNSVILTDFIISGSAIHADVPLIDEESLKNRKIRVFGKESGEMISLLGGTPVTVSFGELYTALQRGTINGALTGMIGAKASKIYEVVNHNTWWNWAYPVEFSIVNKEALAELPEDVRVILLEESAKTTEELQKLQDLLPAQILIESLEQYGIQASGLPRKTQLVFREKMTPIIDDWIKRSGSRGEEAYSIYEKSTADAR